MIKRRNTCAQIQQSRETPLAHRKDTKPRSLELGIDSLSSKARDSLWRVPGEAEEAPPRLTDMGGLTFLSLCRGGEKFGGNGVKWLVVCLVKGFCRTVLVMV